MKPWWESSKVKVGQVHVSVSLHSGCKVERRLGGRQEGTARRLLHTLDIHMPSQLCTYEDLPTSLSITFSSTGIFFNAHL